MFFKVTLVEEDEKVIAHKVQSEVNSSMLFLSVQEYLDCFFFFTFLEEERSFFLSRITVITISGTEKSAKKLL